MYDCRQHVIVQALNDSHELAPMASAAKTVAGTCAGHRLQILDAVSLDVEAELHDVAVLHDVFLALDAGLALGAGFDD